MKICIQSLNKERYTLRGGRELAKVIVVIAVLVVEHLVIIINIYFRIPKQKKPKQSRLEKKEISLEISQQEGTRIQRKKRKEKKDTKMSHLPLSPYILRLVPSFLSDAR